MKLILWPILVMILLCPFAHTQSTTNNSVYDVTYSGYAGGADATGGRDSAPAINAAVAAMGAHPIGRLYFPPGIYRLSSPVIINLGYANVGIGPIQDTAGGFEMDMDGSLRPDAGIGTALYVYGGYYPVLHVKIDGGGSCTTFANHRCNDQALRVNNLVNPTISFYGKDYKGTGVYIDTTGNTGAPGLGSISMSMWPMMDCFRCGQTLDLDGQIYASGIGAGVGGANGLGHIVEAFDGAPVHGSYIGYAGDMEIDHWENDLQSGSEPTLKIEQSASVQISVLSGGMTNTASSIFDFGPSAMVKVSQIQALGLMPCLPDCVSQDGVRVEGGSTIEVGILRAQQINGPGLHNIGSLVSIGTLESFQVTHHVQMSTEPPALFPCCAGASTFIGTALTHDAVGEGFLIDAAVTNGILKLSGGYTYNDNTGGAANYDIANNAMGVRLLLSSWQESNPAHPWIASVGTPVPGNYSADLTTNLQSGVKNTSAGAMMYQMCQPGTNLCWFFGAGNPSSSLCTVETIGSIYSSVTGNGLNGALSVCTSPGVWSATQLLCPSGAFDVGNTNCTSGRLFEAGISTPTYVDSSSSLYVASGTTPVYRCVGGAENGHVVWEPSVCTNAGGKATFVQLYLK